MINKYYDQDCNLGMLDGKTVAIIGFGSQGHAHAMNLKESGVDVVVGLRPGSAHVAKAEAAGLKVLGIEEAAEAGNVVMMLVPDELAPDIYKNQIAKHMKEGDTLMFAHGFNIHYSQIQPADYLDVSMVAPKGPGHIVRSLYTQGSGVPCLIAVEQDKPARQKICTGLCSSNRCRQSRYSGNNLQGRNRNRPVWGTGSSVRRCL